MNRPQTTRPRSIRVRALAGAILSSLACASSAAVITVTNPGDQDIAGQCSLRQALLSAIFQVAPSGSSCAPGDNDNVIEIALPTITLTQQELVVGSEGTVTIRGTSANPPRIMRNTSGASFRIIRHWYGGLVLSNVHISDGHVTDGCGGAVASATVSGSTFLTIENSVISGNHAAHDGGGVCAASPVVVRSSTISGNTAGGSGGGLSAGGTLVVERSTISGNQAQASGGGIIHQPSATRNLRIDNSTIADNEVIAGEGGGGLWLGRSNFALRNSTISGNRVAASARGPGVLVSRTGVPAFMSSTLIGNNQRSKYYQDIDGPAGGSITISGSNNLVRHPGSNVNLPGDTRVCNPAIGALAANGGPTRTISLHPTSCARDAGMPNGHSVDQRGPGYPRVLGAAADIGAFEYSDVIFANGFE